MAFSAFQKLMVKRNFLSELNSFNNITIFGLHWMPSNNSNCLIGKSKQHLGQQTTGLLFVRKCHQMCSWSAKNVSICQKIFCQQASAKWRSGLHTLFNACLASNGNDFFSGLREFLSSFTTQCKWLDLTERSGQSTFFTQAGFKNMCCDICSWNGWSKQACKVFWWKVEFHLR